MVNLGKNIKHNKGFTIVELLVVIVVIGILASITIVSYTGVTARAKTTQAQSNANSVQSVVEAMNADNGYYPKLASAVQSGSLSTKLPSGVTLLVGAAALATNKVPTEVKYEICGADATVTGNALGGRISYWNTTTNSASGYIYVGSGGTTIGASPCHTWVSPAS